MLYVLAVLCGEGEPHKKMLDPMERDDLGTIFYVRGDPTNASTLARAGIVTCERVITLSPNIPLTSEESLMDQKNLLTASVIESRLRAWGREDMTCVYDWYSLVNLNQVVVCE